MKKLISFTLLICLCFAPVACKAAGLEAEIASYPWAEKSVRYCFDKGILSGDDYGNFNLGGYITRAQMARIFTDAFKLKKAWTTIFKDSKTTDWYYPYSLSVQNYMPVLFSDFNGGEYVTRQEFAATLVSASGKGASNSYTLTNYNFKDAGDVADGYKNYVETAVEQLYFLGNGDKLLRPNDLLTRAEACSILYRALMPDDGKTSLIGESHVYIAQAVAWARKRGASEKFIDAAPLYWKYGEIFGIRADIMYAQAAKETGYGKYGGAVLPEMNNWAGIKTKNATGDRTEDHETFATPEDGVRAHFNHMCAYVGIEPIAPVHDRYYSVKSMDWAGDVKYAEQLGGKWCPAINYGYEILDMVKEMEKY